VSSVCVWEGQREKVDENKLSISVKEDKKFGKKLSISVKELRNWILQLICIWMCVYTAILMWFYEAKNLSFQ